MLVSTVKSSFTFGKKLTALFSGLFHGKKIEIIPKKMRQEIKTFLSIGAAVAATVGLSQFAFSLESRKKIFQRDGSQCVDCGKRFSDGWLLDASHIDHDHSKPTYDDPSNGRVQCLDDHLQYHQELGDTNAQLLIKKRLKETAGGHTRAWLEAHKTT